LSLLDLKAKLRSFVKESVYQATLRRARDLAGGVSYLARSLGIGVYALDAMIQGAETVPTWVFVRAVDYINEVEARSTPPPGLPANWQDMDGEAKK
jgi:hypothetical protein